MTIYHLYWSVPWGEDESVAYFDGEPSVQQVCKCAMMHATGVGARLCMRGWRRQTA